MLGTLEASLGVLGGVFATLITPLAVARRTPGRVGLPLQLATASAVGLAGHAFGVLALHLSGIRITPGSLGTFHLLLGLLALATFRRAGPSGTVDTRAAHRLLWVWLGVCALTLPFTSLCGQDTYRWQNLASNIVMHGHIPWLDHPVAVLGFSGRAYPLLHSAALASLQTLLPVGVDWGFYALGCASSLLALSGAYVLCERVMGERWGIPGAILLACTPVFVTYNYWVTGRGLFLSCTVWLVVALAQPRSWRALAIGALAALGMLLSHKTALFALPIMLLGFVVSPLLRARALWLRVLLLGLALGLGALTAPNMLLPAPLGHGAGYLRFAGVRLGLLLPLAVLGLLARPEPECRFQVFRAATMLALMLSGIRESMYAALFAAPLALPWALHGARRVAQALPTHQRVLRVGLAVLLLASAFAAVLRRVGSAAPVELPKLAAVLNALDDDRPIRVHGDGRLRVQMEAYTWRSPLMSLDADAELELHRRKRPALTGPPRELARDWIDYGRGVFTLTGSESEWYGESPLEFFVLSAERPLPAGYAILATEGRFRLLESSAQRAERSAP